jgi:hypothetical protein
MDGPKIPRSILEKPAGCMAIEPTASDVSALVRMTKWGAAHLARFCDVDMQLPWWDSPPVLAVALLLRLARDELLTYQTWIDAGNPHGVRVLQNLANRDHIQVHIVTDQIERTLRAHNTVRRAALNLVRLIGPRRHAWGKDLFEQARQRIDTLYPTADRLWRAGREEVHRRAR